MCKGASFGKNSITRSPEFVSRTTIVSSNSPNANGIMDKTKIPDKIRGSLLTFVKK